MIVPGDTRNEAAPPRFIAKLAKPWAIFIGSVLESSILPFPFEILLVGAIGIDPRPARAAWLAGIAVAGCVVASMLFYMIGAVAFEQFGHPLAESLGWAGTLETARSEFHRNGFWIIAAVSFLPIPIQAATLAAGTVGYPILPFLGAIILSRIARFYGIAALAVLAGERLRRALLWLNRHRLAGSAVALVSLGLLAGGYITAVRGTEP